MGLNVFELFGKIGLDDSEFKSGIESAIETGKSFGAIFEGLTAPVSSTETALAELGSTVAETATEAAQSAEKVEQVETALAESGDSAEKSEGKFAKLKDGFLAFAKPMEDFKSNNEKLIKSSESLQSAFEKVTTKGEKIKGVFEKVAHPIETTKGAFGSLKDKMSDVLHPIESLKSKLDATKTSLEEQRNKLMVLTNAYGEADAKVKALTQAFNDSVRETGASSEETQALAAELSKAKAEAADAKEAMDKYADEVNEVGEEEDKASEKTGKFKNALGTIGKGALAAFGAAASGVAALTKSAVESYAEYEQLVGGVDTLFGDASSKVQEYAQKAYKTAGLSANDYMETVTSFSASLLQSLDGDTTKAAEKADLAITDMSDNANKMGTSMESIQNAYQGFAKQNYTMLDNLKLGYGGTKEEMQRLLEDANKLNKQQGINTQYSIDSYADIVDAIHVVQVEMGIYNTTAEEAGTTIQGSLNSAKAAWENVLTALVAGDVNLDEKISELVTSIVGDGTEKNLGVLGNIMPAVESAIKGIGDLVTGLAPVISQQIPQIINDVLPKLIDAAQSLIGGVVEAVPTLLQTVIENLPALQKAALEIVIALSNGISNSLPELIPAIMQTIMQLYEGLLSAESITQIINAAILLITQLAVGLIDAIPILLEELPKIVQGIVDGIVNNISPLIDAAATVITVLAATLTSPNMISQLLKAGLEIIVSLVKGIGDASNQIIQAALDAVTTFVVGIGYNFKAMIDAGGELIEKMKEGISEKWEDVKTWGKDLIDNFISGIKEKWENLKSAVSDTAQIVKDFLGFSEPEEGPLSDFHTYAPDMMDLYAEGIEKNSDKVLEKVEKLAEKIKEKLGEVESYFERVSNIAELEYELWENTEGLGASDAKKAAKKVELLNTQLATQKEIVDSTNIAYQEMIKLYGENSAEALEYKQTLLEEQVEYAKIQNELKETSKSYASLSKSQSNWATVAIKAAKSVAEAVTDATKTATVTVQSQQESSNNAIGDSINELIGLFKSGKAKTSVSNSRDFRSVSYG